MIAISSVSCAMQVEFHPSSQVPFVSMVDSTACASGFRKRSLHAVAVNTIKFVLLLPMRLLASPATVVNGLATVAASKRLVRRSSYAARATETRDC